MLTANTYYAMAVHMKEGGGGDNLVVQVKTPGARSFADPAPYLYIDARAATNAAAFATTGGVDILAGGGPGIGGPMTDDELIVPVAVTADTVVEISITTSHRSGIQWSLNADPSPIGGGIWRTCTTPVTVEIYTHRNADEIKWKLNDGSQLFGPVTAPVYLGARYDIARNANNPSSWTYFLGNLARVQLWYRPIETDQASCLFRDGSAAIGVCKPPAEIWGSQFYASLLEGSEMDYSRMGLSLNGAARLDGKFGARLAGNDDSIDIDTLDYSSDGEFTIAFWFTKTACRIPGNYEPIFAHTGPNPDNQRWWRNQTLPHLHMYFFCTNERGSSTLNGDLVRLWMRDDNGQEGTFDWSLSSAKSGGFVTDQWIHFAMTVSSDAVKLYVDGRELESRSQRTYGGMFVRDFDGDETLLGEGFSDYRGLTREDSVNRCSQFCKSNGFQYMGLQWANQCYCDNNYGNQGEAQPDSPDGQGTCDVDNDGLPDCGFGMSLPNGTARCDPRVPGGGPGGACQTMACGWRNAVYDLSGAEPAYQGCYIDGTKPETCADANDCETCALMEDQGCGWNSIWDPVNRELQRYNDGSLRGECALGGRTSSWECSVSEYGFAREPWNSDRTGWDWAQSEANILWPDPASIRDEFCRARTEDTDALKAQCGAVTLGAETSEADCKSVASNYIGVSTPMTWTDASAYCQALPGGGQLASIHSDAAQTNAVLACADAADDLRCWIGLNDMANEGTFSWSDGSPLDFQHWAPGEPNDWNPDPDCATSERGCPDNYDPNNLVGEDAVGLYHDRDVCRSCTQAQERAVESWNDFNGDNEMPFVCQTVRQSTAVSEGPNCVYGADASLGGFTLDQVYPPNSEIIVPVMDMTQDPPVPLGSGMHIFTASAAWGYGWHDGYWEVRCANTPVDANGDAVTPLAGGPRTGQVLTSSGFGFFNVPRTNCEVQLRLVTGYTASDISWYFDDINTGHSGPDKGTITLGGSRYEGQIAGVSIMRRAIDEDEADCLYRDGEGSLQVCATADVLSKDRMTAYYSSFTDGDEIPQGTHLMGDAYTDGDFGVQLDGQGDYLYLDAGWRTASYGQDGTFAISMWFTKTSECSPGSTWNGFETLFSHKLMPDQGSGESWNSNVQIEIGCDDDGAQSTIGGDIIRTWLVDDSRHRGVFDTAMNNTQSGGYVSDQWIHLILMVDHTSIQMYLDGVEMRSFGYPLNQCDGCETWAQTGENIAWPIPQAIVGAGAETGCTFPFLWHGVSYNACTDVRSPAQLIFHGLSLLLCVLVCCSDNPAPCTVPGTVGHA